MEEYKRRSKPVWLVYLIFAALLALLIVTSMRATLAEAPAREAVMDLGPWGLVTLQLKPDPYPPLRDSQVRLEFNAWDSRRRPILPDGIEYAYGRTGDDFVVGTGSAQPEGPGSTTFVAHARFPDAGKWWLRVWLRKGDLRSQVRYNLKVEQAR